MRKPEEITIERATARRVSAYRRQIAVTSAFVSNIASDSEDINRGLQILGHRKVSLFRRLIGKCVGLLNSRFKCPIHGPADRNDMSEDEVFERLNPALQCHRHPTSPYIEAGTVADEEKRIARAVAAHRLSERRK